MPGYISRLMDRLEEDVKSLEREEETVRRAIEAKRDELTALETRLRLIQDEKAKLEELRRRTHGAINGGGVSAGPPGSGTTATVAPETVQHGVAVGTDTTAKGEERDHGGEDVPKEVKPVPCTEPGGAGAQGDTAVVGGQPSPREVRRWTLTLDNAKVGEATYAEGTLIVKWIDPVPPDSPYIEGVIGKKVIPALVKSGSASEFTRKEEPEWGTVWEIRGLKPENVAGLVEYIKFYTALDANQKKSASYSSTHVM